MGECREIARRARLIARRLRSIGGWVAVETFDGRKHFFTSVPMRREAACRWVEHGSGRFRLVAYVRRARLRDYLGIFRG